MRTTLYNRFVQVFAAIILAGSLGTILLSGRPGAVPFGLLLFFLYVVPLFGLLIGVSAAHEEHDERPFLWSQPLPRSAFVLGKVASLSGALAIVLVLSLIPAFFAVSTGAPLVLLWGLGVALVVISVSVGVAVGQFTTNRARGLVTVLVLWFGAFVLYDVLALVAAGFDFLQAWPAVWVGLLLLNPVDAIRLTGLFGLEQMPFAPAGEAVWIADVATWLPAWVAVLTIAWTALALSLACRRLSRLDL